MKKSVLTALFSVLLAAWDVCSGAAEPQGPTVVVSIKPLHSLVAGVMEGVGEPQLLIRGGGSPHGYSLRPSEARMLDDARLIVWVGPRLESFLEKALSTLGANASRLELAGELESALLPVRGGGNWDAHPDGQGKDHDHDDHGDLDQHFWLNPLMAKRIVAETVSALTEVDPAHQAQYQRNAVKLNERLDRLHHTLQKRLEPVREIPYVVFHDAYQYFEAAYGLNAVGSITIAPDRKPGARRILEIRKKIEALNARCVFSEPQFEPRLVATVIEGTGARTGVLDPLGSELPEGINAYFLLMNDLANNLAAGLRQ